MLGTVEVRGDELGVSAGRVDLLSVKGEVVSMTSTVSVSTMAGVGSPLRLAPCGMAATRRIMADGFALPVSES
jgi:hypothetical protein